MAKQTIRTLKKLEQNMREIEVRLAGYLYERKKYRLTDTQDIKRKGLKWLKQRIKTTADLLKFTHYNYYLGKWMAYQYILHWTKKEILRLEKKEKHKKTRWSIFRSKI